MRISLRRRGYKVNIGKLGEEEVDFVAKKGDALTYFQVTASMTAEETFQREMRPLQKIKDNYEKIVLTLDKFTPGNYEGIKVIQVLDWLCTLQRGKQDRGCLRHPRSCAIALI